MRFRSPRRAKINLMFVAALTATPACLYAQQIPQGSANAHDGAGERLVLEGASIAFDFSAEALSELDLWFTARGEASSDIGENTPPGERAFPLSLVFDADTSSTLSVACTKGGSVQLEGSLRTCGAIMSFIDDERVVLVNPALEQDPAGELRVVQHDGDRTGETFFTIDFVSYRLTHGRTRFELVGTIHPSRTLADRLGAPDGGDMDLGELRVEGNLVPVYDASEFSGSCSESRDLTGMVAGWTPAEGPDVIVADLPSVVRYGRIGDITAFAIATVSCNLGNERASWISYTNQHPVIYQSAYRLNEFGLQQIGMAWLKHGFYAVSQSLCTPCNDPTNGTALGVGCSDPYSAPLNGDQSNMNGHGSVNAHTGYFPYPMSDPPYETLIDRRLQIHDEDLDPARNAGARYFIQGHYITADDAAAGNQDNNASYREVRIAAPNVDTYSIIVDPAFSTRRGRAPVQAWKDTDPDVVESALRVPGEGLFILAAKPTDLGNGSWRYVYSLQNLNSDRAARTFSVEFPVGSVVSQIGFNDVDYHSGEPFDGTDWLHVFDGRYLTWSTQTIADNVHANALRYDSVYTFWFECNVPPGPTKVTVDLFKSGIPDSIAGDSVGPRLEMVDCNGNGIADSCDIRCDAPGCLSGCGESADCNGNQIPDDCEPDCNENGIADPCDLLSCPPGDLQCDDCNSNGVPDGCEPDCDDDGIIDDCDPPTDTDGDGVTDCFDLCPTNTPEGACQCPAFDMCCFANGICIPDYPRINCFELGGTPSCVEAPCRNGCLLGDYDNDGDIDLRDVYELQSCFSASKDLGGHVRPPQECTIPLDFDYDEDIDNADYQVFHAQCTGP